MKFGITVLIYLIGCTSNWTSKLFPTDAYKNLKLTDFLIKFGKKFQEKGITTKAVEAKQQIISFKVLVIQHVYTKFNYLLLIILEYNKLKSCRSAVDSSYFVCFFHVTDFDTCRWVESWKSPSSAGREPFVVDKNLWKVFVIRLGLFETQ